MHQQELKEQQQKHSLKRNISRSNSFKNTCSSVCGFFGSSPGCFASSSSCYVSNLSNEACGLRCLVGVNGFEERIFCRLPWWVPPIYTLRSLTRVRPAKVQRKLNQLILIPRVFQHLGEQIFQVLLRTHFYWFVFCLSTTYQAESTFKYPNSYTIDCFRKDC